MPIRDGNDNKRYIVMDMEHLDYSNTINDFRRIHVEKAFAEDRENAINPNDILTVIPNIANTQAIVKVVGHVGWLEDEATRLTNSVTSGLMLNVYNYDELPNVHALLASSDWPHDEELEAELESAV